MEEWNLSVDAAGNVDGQKEQSEQERDSKLTQIIAMIQDESTPPAKIKRLIAEEIAAINKLMIKYGNDVSIIEGMKVKIFETQVKSLRELGKEIMEADTLSHKDFLNIDGKKFKFVIGEYAEGLKEAMKMVKLDDTTIRSVQSHWQDIMASKEEDIRREVEKLDKK